MLFYREKKYYIITNKHSQYDQAKIVTRTLGLTPPAELTACSCRALLLDLAATDLTLELGPRLSARPTTVLPVKTAMVSNCTLNVNLNQNSTLKI